MREIVVPLGDRSYPIHIGTGSIDAIGTLLQQAGIAGSGNAVALVQDAAVARPYGARVEASLRSAGYAVVTVSVPSGEASKCLDQLGRLYHAFSAARLDRGSAVVALGGGVVGDLAGFAAATYLRGIDLVQIPTTLLAQVDSSVGGKTAIDLPSGKNLVGSFHQPRFVLVDLDTLDTLPDREFRSGLAEVIKYGIIADPAFFTFLELNRQSILDHQSDSLEHIVARSCEIKAAVVGKDERESGLRAILNYGHTLGHAVEAVAGYGRYLHGEAIAIGTAAAGWLSQRVGWLAEEPKGRIDALMAAYGLPIRADERLDPGAVVTAMRLDKKTRGGILKFVLAREIGRVEVTDVSEDDALAALETIQP